MRIPDGVVPMILLPISAVIVQNISKEGIGVYSWVAWAER
jgi:hypothetical protein